MNELLQQFVVESRELISSVSEELEILRRAPEAAEQLDAVLRVFHTLKGGAGIVGLTAMERTMHAAEETLSAARPGTGAGAGGITDSQCDQCLAYLDQALQWLTAIERTDELPQSARREAAEMIGRFGQLANHASSADRTSADRTDEGKSPAPWLEQIGNRHPDTRTMALWAVRFVPAEDSFYQGEDPLARMLSLPGLLALDCAANSAWQPLEALDPFICNLTLTALSAAPLPDVVNHLKGHTGECEFLAVAPGGADETVQSLPATVAAVIQAQVALLSAGTPADFVGRVASAGLVAANALHFCGRIPQAHLLSRATERSLRESSAEPLRQALAASFTVPRPPAGAEMSPTPLTSGGTAARTVRVDAERVDALVRLAGEFAVIKNAIGHVAKLAVEGDSSVPELLRDRHAGLERLTDELQRSVLGMRVQPLRTVLQRFPPLVREMATRFGKPVRLTVEGEDTEADKAIVEMLFEPLLHLVRNAIDHGVESPQERMRSQKPPVASLQIRAERLADQIIVEVRDDGAGIDVTRVGEIARSRGVVTQEQLDTMTEADIIDLIFAPGFSTAREVTAVSGRGVGMDVVRNAVERVGGRVSIASGTGQGTAVKLFLPFSVMMTQVMTVEVGGQIFGLALDAIVETARIPQAAIVPVGAAQALVLRGRTIPLIDLASVVGDESAQSVEADATVVVVAANGDWGGIRVDRVVERLNLILEPLDGLLAGTPGISGTTLLGDGRVLLVLDIGEMLQ